MELTDNITSIAFHPNIRILAIGSIDNKINLWNFRADGSDFTHFKTINLENSKPESITFDPRTIGLLAFINENHIEIWNYNLGNKIRNIPIERFSGYFINSVAFNPILPILAFGCSDNNVRLLNLNEEGYSLLLSNHTKSVNKVLFHPTNQYILASISVFDHTIKLLKLTDDFSNGTVLISLEHKDLYISSIAFCPIAPIIAVFGSFGIILYKFSSDYSSVESNNKIYNYYTDSVSFHPTASFFVIGEKHKVILYKFSPENLELMKEKIIQEERIQTGKKIVEFCITAPLLVTNENNNKVKLWKINEDVNFRILHSENSRNNNSSQSRSRIMNSERQPPQENSVIQPLRQFPQENSERQSRQFVSLQNTSEIRPKKILIEPELLEPKTNSANQSCPNFNDLYKKIMGENLSASFKFEYKGQKGKDYGGLSRDIFDKLLPTYTSRFFTSIEKNHNFLILKKKEDMSQPNLEKLLDFETNQMIALAKAANSLIFLRINPRLLKLLQSKSLKEYFNNSKINSENSENLKNLYDYINWFTSQNNNNTNNKTFLVDNTANSKIIIKRFKEEKNENLKKILKSEIRLRKFAIDCGFETWEQLDYMSRFIKKFWNPKTFTAELKFDIESFVEKLLIEQIKLDGYEQTNNGHIIPKLKVITIPLERFGKLSEDRKEFVFNESFNQSEIDLFAEYSLFKPFLHFILGLDDENRKIFIRSISGSEYYPGNLTIRLTLTQSSETLKKYPFHTHTCSNFLDFYKSSEKINNRNLKNIINSIKFQLEQNIEFSSA